MAAAAVAVESETASQQVHAIRPCTELQEGSRVPGGPPHHTTRQSGPFVAQQHAPLEAGGHEDDTDSRVPRLYDGGGR